jgi:uncharacterized protein (TIGR02996 family)
MSEAAFLQAIRQEFDDAAPRLVYADWLEERGEAARAEFLRLQERLRTLKPSDPRHKDLDARLREVLASPFDPDWLARVERTDRYTVLWPNDRCRRMEAAGEVGRPLSLVRGGQNKQTRFSDMKVRAGDYLYPLRVQNRRMYVVARMRIKAVPSPAAYYAAHPELLQTAGAFGEALRLAPAGDILVGEGGTPIRFDVAAPPDVLERLTFRSKKKERRLRHVEEGELRSSIEVQGVFRLTHRSAQDFDDLLRNARPLGDEGE